MTSVFFSARPLHFLDRGFATYLDSRDKKSGTKPARPLPALDQYAALWGQRPASELVAMLSVLNRRRFPEFASWQPRFGPSNADIFNAPVLPKTGNLFANMLLSDAQTYQTPQLVQVLSASVFIGASPDGDAFLHCSADGFVYRGSHEDGSVGEPVATSLSAFAYAMALDDASSGGAVDDRELSSWLKALKGHVSPALNPTTQTMKGALRTELQTATVMNQRSAWLLAMLREGGTGFDGAREFTAARRAKHDTKGDAGPASAVYRMLHAFFTGDHEQLSRVLKHHTKSKSRITSDAARLVNSWQQGKSVKLGDVDDIRELAAEFRSACKDREAPKSGRRGAARTSKGKSSNAFDVAASWRGSSPDDNLVAYKALLKLRESGATQGASALVPLVGKHTQKLPKRFIPQMLRHAIRLLGEAKEPTAAPVLAKVAAFAFDKKRMEDDDFPSVVHDAIVALGELGDASAVPLLTRIVSKSESYKLKSAAAEALLGIQGAVAVPHAFHAVEAYDGSLPDAELTWALGAVATKADSKTRARIIKLLLEDGVDNWQQETALAALGALVSLGKRDRKQLEAAVKAAMKKQPALTGLPLMTMREEEPAAWALRVGAFHGLVSREMLKKRSTNAYFDTRLVAKRLLRRG